MEDVLYADILFIINFSMDFITLYLTSRLTSGPPAGPRFAAAAAIGALFGTVSVAVGIDGIAGIIATGAAAVIMILAAFGKSSVERVVTRTAIFWGAAALLGGVMTALMSVGDVKYAGQGPAGITAILLSGSAVCVLIARAMVHAKRRRSVRIKVSLHGKSASFDALCDSGNLLSDPLSSRPVILAELSVLRPLLPWLTTASAAAINAESIPPDMSGRMRIIPVKGFGGDRLLFGFLPESVIVSPGSKDARCDAVIAVTDFGDKFFGGFPANAPYPLH